MPTIEPRFRKRPRKTVTPPTPIARPTGASAVIYQFMPRPPKPPGKLHFSVNGVPMGSPPGKGQNKISGIAYFHTKGCVKGFDRLPLSKLLGMLKILGVTDWRAGGWSVTFPNGKVISAVLVPDKKAGGKK